MWVPKYASALRSVGRAEHEHRLLSQLVQRPVLVLGHTSPSERDDFRRRPHNPFAPTFQPPNLQVSVAQSLASSKSPSKPAPLAEVTRELPRRPIVLSRNLKEAWSVASRTGDLPHLRSLVSFGDFWCLRYASWLLGRCGGTPEMIDCTHSQALARAAEQLQRAANERSLGGMLARMPSLLALSEMEQSGVHIADPDSISSAASTAANGVAAADTELRRHLHVAWNGHSVRWSSPTDVRDVLLGKRVDDVAPPSPTDMLELTVVGAALLSFGCPKIMKRLLRGSTVLPFSAARVPAKLKNIHDGVVSQQRLSNTQATSALRIAREHCGAVLVAEEADGQVSWRMIDKHGRVHEATADPRCSPDFAAALDDHKTLVVSRLSTMEAAAVSAARPTGPLVRAAPLLQVLKAVAKQVAPQNAAKTVSLIRELHEFAAPFTETLRPAGAKRTDLNLAIFAAAGAAGVQSQSNVWAAAGSMLPGLLSPSDPAHQRARALLSADGGAKTDQWEAALPAFAAKMRAYRAAARSVSAIFDSEGFFSMAHDDRCIRGELVATGAATGRLASRNPNIQNIDTSEAIRRLFLPRMPDAVCVEADYSQLEVNVLALLSGDTRMIEDLRRGVDFHCKRATALVPMSYDELYQKCKVEHDERALAARKLAKQFSFQRQYGAGVASIAASTGMSVEDVQRLADAEAAMYPDTVQYVEWLLRDMQSSENRLSSGYVTRLPSGQGLIVPQVRGKPSPTAARNFPVQGFAAHIVQVMIGRLYRRVVSDGLLDRGVTLTNTVHDCVWLESPTNQLSEVVAILREELENVPMMVHGTVPGFDCAVPFPVSVQAGASLGDLRVVQ
uniref:DNA-directed DNA polymerase family A palm domain-containing protein n=1 Tax=Neobodo designis TaxID=312471 RepID=A0A7S1MUJ1_NEODS